jgi:hypothetical protein
MQGDASLSLSFSKTLTLSTQSDESCACKEWLLLKFVLRPYLGYLKKKATLCQEEIEKHVFDKLDVWRSINTLKAISTITFHFTAIGRYYKKVYGHLVILLC